MDTVGEVFILYFHILEQEWVVAVEAYSFIIVYVRRKIDTFIHLETDFYVNIIIYIINKLDKLNRHWNNT